MPGGTQHDRSGGTCGLVHADVKPANAIVVPRTRQSGDLIVPDRRDGGSDRLVLDRSIIDSVVRGVWLPDRAKVEHEPGQLGIAA